MDNYSIHKALIYVAENGSFSVAAERMGVSKVMISRSIKSLEEKVGFRLLDRNARGSKLTAKGKVYVERCQPLLRKIDESYQELEIAQSSLQDDTSSDLIKLKIGSTNTFGSEVLGHAICEFKKAYPNYLIELITDESFQDLLEHKLDISIRAHLSDESIHEGLISRVLVKLPFFLCCSPDYLANQPAPKTFEELFDNHAFAAWSHLNQHENVCVHRGNQLSYVPKNINFVSNNSMACLSYVISGGGITMLPFHLIQPALEEGKLMLVLPEKTEFIIELRMTYLNAQGRLSATTTFIEYMLKCHTLKKLEEGYLKFR